MGPRGRRSRRALGTRSSLQAFADDPNALWESEDESWRNWLASVGLTSCIRFARVCMSTDSRWGDSLLEDEVELRMLSSVFALIEAPLFPIVRLFNRALRAGELPPCEFERS